ncbi:c-type cytochrome [Acetobacter sacchari]|uniref:C-type cytochrome n=1 Tax=Acetobacter sacchari TaxID=2661687 RepID=A0ABS3LYA7_9PROT|nr:cytochrome c [Acetobacter sacchari]MBO1360873.1 c-type cytochrome [Acetobacter sacchari]
MNGPRETNDHRRRLCGVGRLCTAAVVFVLSFCSANFARADTHADLVARGEYLTRAADCEVCHTAKGGVPFAGGLKFDIAPFGAIYSGNITPDRDSGLGGWSEAAFVRAVREGKGPEGRLYPAMPYQDYGRMSVGDAQAIWAYLKTLPPARSLRPENTGVFAYGIVRSAMIGWNLLYGPRSDYPDDHGRSGAWNRGRFLVLGLGHCQECHSPRNWMMAASDGRAFAGNVTDGWLAYNLSSDRSDGLGAWTDAELIEYLSTGHTQNHGSAAGPMGSVVGHSLRFLTQDDIRAMVTYLRSVPPQSQTGVVERAAADKASIHRGARLYQGACIGCHLESGDGRNTHFGDIHRSHTARASDGRNLVQAMIEGTSLETQTGAASMPEFGHGYDDRDIADIANYVLASIGHAQGHVDVTEVTKARDSSN